MIKKRLIMSLFLIFLVAVTIFPSITSSQPEERAYDPFIDTNDDGAIRVDDVLNIALHFGTTGTPINKSALLELLPLIDEMNATILELQERVAELEAYVAVLEYLLGIPTKGQKIFPSDDAQTVRETFNTTGWFDTSDENFGDETWLVVRTTVPDDREGRVFLKFSLDSISSLENITSVKLYLYHSGHLAPGWSGVGNVEARAVSDDSWTEANITWNNQPDYEDLLETGYITPSTAQWYSWNVTSFILNELAGDQVASLCLKAENEDEGSYYRWALFRSKEYNGFDPYLLVEYEETYEDFTTYTEVLGGGADRYNQTTTQSSWAGLRMDDPIAYVYKDYGVAAFTTFEHQMELHISAINSGNDPEPYRLMVFPYAVSNDHPYPHHDDRLFYYIMKKPGDDTKYYVTFIAKHNDVNSFVTGTPDSSVYLDVGTTYYVTVSKIGATFRLVLRLDSHSGAIVWDSGDCIGWNDNYQYLYVPFHKEYTDGGNYTIDGYVENLNLQP